MNSNNQEVALAAFIASKTEIDALPARFAAASQDQTMDRSDWQPAHASP